MKILLMLFVLSVPHMAGAPAERKVDFTDQEFRDAVVSFFHSEIQRQESYFSRFEESFLDDPKRIEFGEYWSENPGFNYFTVDRIKMKYEFNYMIGNFGMKIHGDIQEEGAGLQCKESKTVRFLHINRR